VPPIGRQRPNFPAGTALYRGHTSASRG
jgi:hypothetical protein